MRQSARISGINPVIALLILVSASCSSPESTSDGKPYVVATLPIVAHLVRPVAGDAIPVRVLVRRPVSAHAYELRPTEAALVAGASGVFAASRGVDGWITSYTSTDVQRLFDGGGHGWADPLLAAAAVRVVGSRLCTLFPEDCDGFQQRAAAYSDSLGRLADQIGLRLGSVSPGSIALSEPFFAPFMDRYKLGSATILRTVPEHDPSPASVRRAVGGAANIRAVIVPSTMRDRLAEELAGARGWTLIPIDPIGLAYDDYTSWLTASVDTLLARLPDS